MEEWSQKEQAAVDLFMRGYNCAQSVAAVFYNECGVSMQTMLAVSSGFGGGFSRLREMCGAVSGMTMVVGTVMNSVPSPKNKSAVYTEVQKLALAFEAENGSYLCRDLLGLRKDERSAPIPAARTPQYYAERPCQRVIRCAVRMTEAWLAEYAAKRATDDGSPEKTDTAKAVIDNISSATDSTLTNTDTLPVFPAPEAPAAFSPTAAPLAKSDVYNAANSFSGTQLTNVSNRESLTVVPLDEAWLQAHLPARNDSGNKGCFGKVIALCGSRQYRGAALLCTEAALRSGAGLVTLAGVPEVLTAASIRLPEAVCLPMSANESGCVSTENCPALLQHRSEVCVCGCGLGQNADTRALLQELLVQWEGQLILDADALNIAAELPQLWSALKKPPILTPHPGEMARLCGCEIEVILADPTATALHFATYHRCIVVLKGATTVIALPCGSLFIHDMPNSGLAKGGSGDVLAGLIAGYSAQGCCAADAACLGVLIHGKAAAATAQKCGKRAMLASDVLHEIR